MGGWVDGWMGCRIEYQQAQILHQNIDNSKIVALGYAREGTPTS